jgi:hypothetical protein
MGGAALALPFLELFERQGRAQSGGKKSRYIVFCYTPNGVWPEKFWPLGTETNFMLSPILAPFEPYKKQMLILGPQMTEVFNNSPKGGAGLAYGGPTLLHQAPITLAARVGSGCGLVGKGCMSTDPNSGLPYRDQLTANNSINGPSIDQVIANAVKGDSLFGSLNFGLHPIGGDTPSDIHFAMDGTALKRMASADEAWSRLFGAPITAVGPDGAATQAAADLRKQTAVSDFLHARFGALRTAVSAADRRTIDAHLSALRTLEDRKTKLLMAKATPSNPTQPNATQPGMCPLPNRAMVPTDADSIRTGADTQFLSPFFMDMIVTAFTCRLTKVASVSFGYPGGGDEGGLRMPWLGFTDPQHGLSHHGNTGYKMDRYQKMSTWIAGEVAGLMQRLAAVRSPSGTGSLLDDTTIYWFNRHGEGNAHTNYALPNIILGGTGGYFDMGRYLKLPATNPTKVLISLANAMGVDVPSFGENAFKDTAPLSGLAA